MLSVVPTKVAVMLPAIKFRRSQASKLRDLQALFDERFRANKSLVKGLFRSIGILLLQDELTLADL